MLQYSPLVAICDRHIFALNDKDVQYRTAKFLLAIEVQVGVEITGVGKKPVHRFDFDYR